MIGGMWGDKPAAAAAAASAVMPCRRSARSNPKDAHAQLICMGRLVLWPPALRCDGKCCIKPLCAGT